MKTLLVTGGCGFIGSHFIKFFLKNHTGWKVANYDKLTYSGNRENTRELEGNSRYEFIRGDICDLGSVHMAVEKSDAVIHFAAETHVDRSIDNASAFMQTNVYGAWCLLEAARRYAVKRFVHVSTDEVYGSIDQGAADENFPLLPNSPYAASKAAADLLVRSYWKTYDYMPMIVRSTNNFGSYQFPEKVIPLFVTNLLEKLKLPVYGQGENRRQWLYVEDHCEALSLVFDHGRAGEIYNIGAGNEISNNELAHTILRLMGEKEDKIEHVADRPGHDLRYSVDTTKITKLGFRPRWEFEEALKKTIQWYEQHAAWWRPLKRDKFTVKMRA